MRWRDALALAVGVVPLCVLGFWPVLDDYYFWGVSPLRYLRPLGPMCLLVVGAVWVFACAAGNMRHSFSGILDRTLFDRRHSAVWVVGTAMVFLALTSLVHIYDLAGDNVTTVKWVLHPLAQGQKRAIPNSYIFHLLLKPWLSDYDGTVDAWRWISRISVVPYVVLVYFVSRMLTGARWQVFLLLLTAGVALYNYFGHVDYYAVQTLYLLGVLLVVLGVMKERIGIFWLVPALVAGTVLYLPIGLVLLAPCFYVVLYRFRSRIRLHAIRWIVVGVALAGFAALPYVSRFNFVPLTGGAEAVLSVNRLVLFLNHLVYSMPLLMSLLWIGVRPVTQVFRDAWFSPFRSPQLVVAVLMVLPGMFINAVSVYYYGWFELDNMGIYLTIPVTLLLGVLLGLRESERGQAEQSRRSSRILAEGVVAAHAVFGVCFLVFFASPRSLEAYVPYIDRYTASWEVLGFNHTGNRTPVLLALGLHKTAAEWLDRKDTGKFPVSLLNWQDVLMDYSRKGQKGKDLKPFEPFRRNPWFWLVQLQPGFVQDNPQWLRQREEMYAMLGRGLDALPAAAQAGFFAFRCFDALMFGGGRVPEEAVRTQAAGLAHSLGRYFGEDLSGLVTNTVRIDYRRSTYAHTLDVTGTARAGAEGEAPALFHYQFLYFWSGANYVTASNFTGRGNSPRRHGGTERPSP